jgi:hypothetical protein
MSKINSNEVKRFFRDILGIKVSVNTVACRNPFVQVYVKSIPNDDIRAPMQYEKLIPAEFGQRLLGLIYGENAPNTTFPAGNSQENRCSITAEQWEGLKKLYAYTPPAK